MDAVKKISPAKLEMLRLLLQDNKIKSCIIVDGSYAGEIDVTETGDIKLGRTKFGWVNSLFNMYTTIDFFTMASKIAAIITGCVKQSNERLVGMIQEIIDKVLINDDREQIIDLLFQYIVLFDKDSPYYSKYELGQNKMPIQTPIGCTYVDFGGQVIPVPVTLDKIK